jgi:ribonuclease P protein component
MSKEKPEGLSKEERVRQSDDFTRILQGGRRIRGHLVNAYWILDESAAPNAPNRVGIAAGRKLGPAVVRNRLKRHLREAYRRNKRELPCRGIAIVFVASPRMIRRPWSEVAEDVRTLLRGVAASNDGASSPSGSS